MIDVNVKASHKREGAQVTINQRNKDGTEELIQIAYFTDQIGKRWIGVYNNHELIFRKEL